MDAGSVIRLKGNFQSKPRRDYRREPDIVKLVLGQAIRIPVLNGLPGLPVVI